MSENKNCTYKYDYNNKCDCSEDDNCGCSYPNNTSHDFSHTCQKTEKRPIEQHLNTSGN